MSWWNFWLFILMMAILWDLSYPSPHSVFSHFEILRGREMKVRTKRNSRTGQVRKHVTFSALQKMFRMILSPGSPVLHPQFQATKVDGHGVKTNFKMDLSKFYTGFLRDTPHVEIDAAYIEGVWLVQIYHTDTVYTVEPLRHHDPLASGTDMLVYKSEDVKRDNMTGSAGGHGQFPFCHQVDLTSVPQGSKIQDKKAGNVGHSRDATHRHFMTEKSGNDPGKKGISRNTTDPHIISDKYRKTRSLNIDREKLFRSKRFDKSSNDKEKRENTGHVPRYDTCEVIAVADYEVYRKMGESNAARVASFLIYVHQASSRLLRAAQFGNMTGVGTLLKSVLIHTSYTVTKGMHYNMEDNPMDGDLTLRSMAKYMQFQEYCLMHMTTQRNFGVVLGLAARGSKDNLMGICGHDRYSSFNLGMSTISDMSDNIVAMQVYIVVVTHEFGHNFGSGHDDDVVDRHECYPSSSEGGKYIMWGTSGNTLDRNSPHFSPCSREVISELLQVRAHLCFIPSNTVRPVCGNGLVDPGEDCDIGFDAGNNADSCCRDNCAFAEGAVCSPANHPCCTNKCTVAPTTTKCQVYEFQPCYDTPLCPGTRADECLQPLTLPNNSSCDDGGTCMYGECLHFCHVLGLSMKPPHQIIPCSCDQDTRSMCRHCCIDVTGDHKCKVMGGVRRDGEICLKGSCVKGNCEKTWVKAGNPMDFTVWNFSQDNAGCRHVFSCWLTLVLLIYTSLRSVQH